MRFSSFARVATLAFVSATLVGACGGDSPTPSGNNNTAGPMTASINGAQWTANSATAFASSSFIVINGTRVTAPNYSLAFTLYNVAAAGIYPLGVNVNMIGGSVVVSSPTLGGWGTPISGAAGEINITTLTASRIAGTFTFTATPQQGATGNLVATSGTFDMPLTGTLPVLAANAGNKISATIGGTAFNAGTAALVVTSGSTPTVAIAANNIERGLGLSLANVSAAGTYPLSVTPARSIQVTGIPGNATATWGSQLTGGSGSVTITSFTTSRVIGTFTGTLVPIAGGATGNLAITGSFDMGRP